MGVSPSDNRVRMGERLIPDSGASLAADIPRNSAGLESYSQSREAVGGWGIPEPSLPLASHRWFSVKIGINARRGPSWIRETVCITGSAAPSL